MYKKLSVVGSGSWGTALAQVFADNFKEVIVWGRNSETINDINREHVNKKYLPEIRLKDNIKGTTDINEAFFEGDIVIISIPTQRIREVLKNVKSVLNKPVVSASKGIEIESLKLPSRIIQEVLSMKRELVLALSGPSFAKEVAKGLPTAVTLAGEKNISKEIQKTLNTETFRLYISDDINGVQVGGAVKNIIAIATGASDGLGLGYNARAGLITRGLYEMTKVAKIFGGKPETLYGLSGLGDLVLTATGELSRNRTFGYLLGKGNSIKEAFEKVGQVVEGAKTVKAIRQIALKYNLELPISDIVYRVIYENLSPKDAVRILMSREPKEENFS